MSRFKIGQKVVCVKTHSGRAVVKGSIHTVKGLKGRCPCKNTIHVGIADSNIQNHKGLVECSSCGHLGVTNNYYLYLKESLFAPLQEDGSTKSLVEEIIEEGVLEELKLEEIEVN